MKKACDWSMPDARRTGLCKWVVKKHDMNLNKPKTKFMEIKFSFPGQAHPLMLEGEIIEKFKTFLYPYSG